jgi:hypothetical protein
MRWIVLCTNARWVDLVPNGTESQILQIQGNWSFLSTIEYSISIVCICRCILTQLEWFKLIYNFIIWDDCWNAIKAVGTGYNSSQILVTYWSILILACLTLFITLTQAKICMIMLIIFLNSQSETRFHKRDAITVNEFQISRVLKLLAEINRL